MSPRTREYLPRFVLRIFLENAVDLNNDSPSPCSPRRLLGTCIREDIDVKLPVSLQLFQPGHCRHNKYICSELVTEDNKLNELAQIGDRYLLITQGVKGGKQKLLRSTVQLRRKGEN